MTRALLCAVALATTPLGQAPAFDRQPLVVRIVEVYDGDTVRAELQAPGLPAELRTVSIRVAGIDTPERGWRAACDEERAAAERARALAVEIVAGAPWAVVTDLEWGKFGGRIVGTLRVHERDLGSVMLAAGLAVPYDGGTKSNPWCPAPGRTSPLPPRRPEIAP